MARALTEEIGEHWEKALRATQDLGLPCGGIWMRKRHRDILPAHIRCLLPAGKRIILVMVVPGLQVGGQAWEWAWPPIEVYASARPLLPGPEA